MEQILVYGDSLSWGIIPGTRQRLRFDERWPGILEHALAETGRRVRVIENCLNGRRTVWEDPFKPGRSGRGGLPQVIECHSPLVLVILMLGTNDFQASHDNKAWMSAQGIKSLVQEIRGAPIEPGMPIPAITVVAPPPIGTPKGQMAAKFHGADVRCVGAAEEYRKVAEELGVHFYDSAQACAASAIDGIHLDGDQHARLGRALAREVPRWLLERGAGQPLPTPPPVG